MPNEEIDYPYFTTAYHELWEKYGKDLVKYGIENNLIDKKIIKNASKKGDLLDSLRNRL